MNAQTVTFNAEHEALFTLLDHLDAAYALTDYAPIREHIHMAKVETERYLGESLLRAAKSGSAAKEET